MQNNPNQMPQQQPMQPQQPMSAQPVQQPQPQQPQQPPQMPPQMRQGIRPNSLVPTTKGPNPKAVLFGCLGFFIFSIILYIVFVIAFVSQNSEQGNAMANALGVNAAEFTNSLILLTNLIFGVVVIVSLIVGIFSVFKLVSTPKTDKEGRGKGLRQTLIAAAFFILMLFSWVGVYLFLSGKQVDLPRNTARSEMIVTNPVNTIQQTAPFKVTFDGTKIPYDSRNYEILFYEWDFGDGGTSNSPTVEHTFTRVGTFDVKLTVTARNLNTQELASETFNKLITISNVRLNADFTATPERGPAPLTVEFDGSLSSSPAGQITSYAWDFRGVNNFRDAEGQKATFTFEREGEYTVSLRVTDNTGQAPEIITKTIVVEGENAPVAVIDIPTEDGKYYVEKQYTFMGEKSTSPNGNINAYEWDFGDGSPKANTRTVSHTYRMPGVYEVILKVTDSTGKIGVSSQKLNLTRAEMAPNAVITTIPALNDAKDNSILGTVPFEVSFSGENSTDPDNNIIEYQWDFDGDGKIDTAGKQTKYVYTTPGLYNARLVVTDSAGNESSSVIVVNVKPQDLVARVSADQNEGTSPLTVVFDASGSTYPSGQIASYTWDFGDGTPKRIDASKVTYRYDSIGTFNVTVTAMATDGSQNTAQTIVNVRPIALTACFEASFESGPAPLEIEFDPRCSAGSVSRYLWDFGDGNTSRTRRPVYTFERPGSYQVTLEVADSQNVVNTITKTILVTGNL